MDASVHSGKLVDGRVRDMDRGETEETQHPGIEIIISRRLPQWKPERPLEGRELVIAHRNSRWMTPGTDGSIVLRKRPTRGSRPLKTL